MPGFQRLHRGGGLNLTKRDLETGELPEIDGWENSDLATVGVKSSDEIPPLVVTVCKVRPQDGDQKGRWYYDAEGTRLFWRIPSYAIRFTPSFDYDAYILEIIHPWLCMKCKEPAKYVYEELGRLHSDGRVSSDFICYLAARWLKTGSAYLDEEHNTLGVKAIPQDAQTLAGKPPLPRLIIAQHDVISTRYLDGKQTMLLEPDAELDQLASSTPDNLHVAFVVMCAVDIETGWVLEDSHRQGKQNNKPGFSDEDGMRGVQEAMEAVVKRFRRNLAIYHPEGFASTINQLSEQDKRFHDADKLDPRGWVGLLQSEFTTSEFTKSMA